MDKTVKGASVGAITGAILAIAAKKLVSGDKPLTWKDYAVWGSGGATAGGILGGAIAQTPDAAATESDKTKLDEKIAKLEKEVADKPTREGSAVRAVAKTSGAGLFGWLLEAGLVNNVVNAYRNKRIAQGGGAIDRWWKWMLPAVQTKTKGKVTKAVPRRGGKLGLIGGLIIGGLSSASDIGNVFTPPGQKQREELEQLREDRKKLK